MKAFSGTLLSKLISLAEMLEASEDRRETLLRHKVEVAKGAKGVAKARAALRAHRASRRERVFELFEGRTKEVLEIHRIIALRGHGADTDVRAVKEWARTELPRLMNLLLMGKA